MKNKSYFTKFPKILYDTGFGEFESVDLSVRFKFIEDILKHSGAAYDYYWQDHDRPDIVADKYYGDSDYAWIVLLSAQAYDWEFDLPMDDQTFNNYLLQKYDVESVNELHQLTHHYEDAGGIRIDYDTYERLADTYKRAVSIYDFENTANERKRNIKLISKKYVKQIVREFDIRLQDIKNTRRLFNVQ